MTDARRRFADAVEGLRRLAREYRAEAAKDLLASIDKLDRLALRIYWITFRAIQFRSEMDGPMKWRIRDVEASGEEPRRDAKSDFGFAKDFDGGRYGGLPSTGFDPGNGLSMPDPDPKYQDEEFDPADWWKRSDAAQP